MPGNVPLVAIRLPRLQAVEEIEATWDRGQAVLPLDPAAPDAEVEGLLARLRPTEIVDGRGRRGRRPLAGGVAVDQTVAAVVATSGTSTGMPRGVELTWEGMRASAAAVAGGVEADWHWVAGLPLHHAGGLAVVARAWAGHGRLTVIDRLDAASLAGLSSTPNLVTSMVPVQLARLLDAGVELNPFHRILVGGGYTPPSLVQRARQGGAPIVLTYGLTETWGGVVHDGWPLPGVELRIDDGEILVRAPTVMQGYRLDPGGTREALTDDGWLRTGDLGCLDHEGRLDVVGRRGDVIITGGVSVGPAEVEAVLAEHPQVADACVTGAADPEWGERVVAHVVPADPADPPTLEALQDFARHRLSAPKLPRQLHLVDAIPRNQAGKPLRRQLRRPG